MKKKANALETGLMLMFLICMLAVVFLLYFGHRDYITEFTQACKKECYKFDYGFYKIESPGFAQSYNCWCLEDNEPKNIGNVDIEKEGTGEK